MSLLKWASEFKSIADEILDETDVINILSELGEVNLVGSYRLNVMYQPDLDLTVNSDSPSLENAGLVTLKLIKSGKFQTVSFTDMYNNRLPGKSRGYYWKLTVTKNNVLWKFDIWYSTKDQDFAIKSTIKYEKLLKNNPNKRELILSFKKQLSDGSKYVEGVTSVQIYDAVLNKGADNVKKVFEIKK